MGVFFSILYFSLNWFASSSNPTSASYWESKGSDTRLIQVIPTPDDQGRDLLHINIFLSSNCTTKIYYAMPIKENDLYVLTDTYGKVVDSKAHIVIHNQKRLKFHGHTFRKISKEKYFKDMSLFEKQIKR